MVNTVERGGGSEPGEAGHGDAGAGAGRRGHGSLQASAPQVVQQARLMDSAGTAWHAVKYGNLEMITQLFPSRCNVYARGPVGENVLHTAMLLNTPSTLAIARYLVKLYGPPLVNCPFTDRRSVHDPPSAYEGQTALHIAIVNRDIDMVKFLVQAGADIRARAWGTFFAPDGQMYYGEYPLSFAACTGQKEVVAHLKRHGAAVNSDRDIYGNTALHMCVIHDQPDMYDFLVDYCAANDNVRNYAGLTPLVLAAQLGKMGTFQHIYSRRRRAFYTFGRVTSYSLALREIDTVQDDEDGYVPNALEVILRKGHLEMLEEPLIKTLLRHKWQAFARTQFIAHFVGYLVLEVSQTVLIWLISSKTLWNGPERASQEYVGFTLALIMAFLEIIDYVQWSRESYQRRLTMVSPPPYQPPLYPIPGETREARDGRHGIFHRLSQRMMGSRNSHGGAPSSSSLELTTGSDLGTMPPAATVASQMAASTNAPRKLGDQPSRRFARPLSITESGSVTPAASPSPGATAGGADAKGQQQQQQQQQQQAAVVRPDSARGPPSPFEHPQQQQQLAAEAPRPHVSFASGPRPLGEGRDPLPPAAGAGPSAPSPPPLTGSAAGTPEAPPPLVASVQDRLEAAAREEGSASEADPVDDDDGDVVSVGVAGRRSVGQGPGSGSVGASVAAAVSRSPSRGPRTGEDAAAAAAAGGGDASARSSGTRAGVPPQRIASFARSDSSGAPPVGPSSSGNITGAASASGPLTVLGASQSTGNLSASGRVVGGGAATAPSASNEGALHRQRTRARSGGGDLPSSISALKRVATSSGRHRGEFEGAEGYRSGADGSGKGGGAGGALLGGGSLGAGDLEAGTGPSTGSDPHKSRARAFLETTTEGFRRMLSDPWLFIWHTHLVLTFMHFITWTTTYGGVHGPGPSSRAVREFDDVVVSLMGLTGWLAVIYFFRGFKATGKLAVILERCLVDVVRFVSLYILWNIGFALALFTMTRGVLYVTDTPRDKEGTAPLASATGDLGGGFTSIGFGMISLINLGLGLGLSEYGNICDLGHEVTSVFCTIYYLAYMATSVILLLNLLIAMIIRTYNTAQKAAEAHWRRRWAAYTVKAERRMPSSWVQRLRLGQPAWDPKTQRNLYSHVFETVDDDREGRDDKGALDAQIKAVADLLDTLRRQRGGATGGGSGGGGGGSGVPLDKSSSKSAPKTSTD